ncbi:MAG: hypothetical protein RLZZ238_1086, partial [Planctomycetota bacterium]
MARMPRDRTDSKRSPGGRSIRRTAWLGIIAAGVVCVLFLQVVRLSVAEHATHLRNVERFLTDTRWLPASRGSIR